MASNKQTKSALNSMKMQAATAKQAGSIGGQMVKNMIASYTQQNSAQ